MENFSFFLLVKYLSWKFIFPVDVASFQVETVGDKYMSVSGLPDLCEDHAKNIARLALDMLDMAKRVEMGGKPVV
jgi:hypothetical protein